MTGAIPALALILGAYLLGGAPQLTLLARLRGVRLDGDQHQSLWRRGGRATTVIGVFGEFAKGIIPVAVGWSFGFSPAVLVAAGVAAVAGQMWPLYARFDGEKGNSVAIAMAFMLAWQPALCALVPILLSLAVRTINRLRLKSADPEAKSLVGGAPSASLPLGMLTGFLLLPLASWWLGEPLAITAGFGVLFVLIIVRRLTAGLRKDLATGESPGRILIRRFLYDRATSAWRQ